MFSTLVSVSLISRLCVSIASFCHCVHSSKTSLRPQSGTSESMTCTEISVCSQWLWRVMIYRFARFEENFQIQSQCFFLLLIGVTRCSFSPVNNAPSCADYWSILLRVFNSLSRRPLFGNAPNLSRCRKSIEHTGEKSINISTHRFCHSVSLERSELSRIPRVE